VAIGAQVGYRDLAGFGRRRIDYDPDELRDDVLYQLAALDGMARVAGARVRYVKPHGALYNTVVSDEPQAAAVVAAVVAYGGGLAVLGLPGSALLRLAAEAGLRAVPEGFADRGYLPSGALVPRGRPGALATDPELVAQRAVRMAVEGTVLAIDGSEIASPVESLCVHGDTPGAVDLAMAVRAALTNAGTTLSPFVADLGR
jgi:UPF0271 protein